jgi:hypothetical protein
MHGVRNLAVYESRAQLYEKMGRAAERCVYEDDFGPTRDDQDRAEEAREDGMDWLNRSE